MAKSIDFDSIESFYDDLFDNLRDQVIYSDDEIAISGGQTHNEPVELHKSASELSVSHEDESENNTVDSDSYYESDIEQVTPDVKDFYYLIINGAKTLIRGNYMYYGHRIDDNSVYWHCKATDVCSASATIIMDDEIVIRET